MKYTEKLESLKTEIQNKLIASLNENNEINFEEARHLSYDRGGWNTSSYIDKNDIFKLSTECLAEIADEISGGDKL